MIMVPDNNNKNKNKRKARSAHLKPKPLNLRFKTLKNRILREEKREWSGEGGGLTEGQQKVYNLLLEQKKNNNNKNQDILTVLTDGMQGDADLVLDGKFTVRFNELLELSEHIYESPTTEAAAATPYDLAGSTTTPGTEGKIPPEVDFFTKILKGELYYLIDVEDIPKVVTYISSQPELKEIITFGGADVKGEKEGGGKKEKEAIATMTVDDNNNATNEPPEFTAAYNKALQNPISVATGKTAISMASNYANAAKELKRDDLIKYFTEKKAELEENTAQNRSIKEYARVGKLKEGKPKSSAQPAITELITTNKTFLDNPTDIKIDDVLKFKKELKAAFSAFFDTVDPLTSGRLQTLNILAKINYFYQKMSVYDFVQHQKTSTFGKLFSKGRYTEKAFGSESKGQISESDRKKFKDSKDYLGKLLVAYRKHTDTIIKGSKSSLDPKYFFYELDNAINPSGKVGTIIKAGIKDTIYDNLIRLENSYNKRDSMLQEEFYNFYNEQKDLTIEQMINKSQENKEWLNFLGTKKTRIEELIKQVNETIIPKARAFINKNNVDAAATKASGDAAAEVKEKAEEKAAAQALVDAATAIVTALGTITTYAEATAMDSKEIEHKEEIHAEIKNIDEAVKKLSNEKAPAAGPVGETAVPVVAVPAVAEQGGGAPEDIQTEIKNNPQVKIKLNVFGKSLAALKGVAGFSEAAIKGGGKSTIKPLLEALQTALTAFKAALTDPALTDPATKAALTAAVAKVTEELAKPTVEAEAAAEAIPEDLKANITAATDAATAATDAASVEAALTAVGAAIEALGTASEEAEQAPAGTQALAGTQASEETAQVKDTLTELTAETPNIKTTTAEALQKANELLAAVTAAAKLGAATAAKPVAPVAPSQMSNAEIQALKDRVAKLESDAKNTGDKNKDDETEAAIKAIMMGDDAFAHKIQFLVDIPKWQQFKVIGSTDGSMEDAALNMTTDIARASLSDLKKKELDDDKQMREAIAKALQVIAAAKPKLNDPNPQIQEEANKKTLESLKELKSQLDKVTKDLADVKKKEIAVVDNTKPLSTTDNQSATTSVTGTQPGAQLGATPIITQLQSDTYKIPSPATKDTLAPIIAALKTLVTPQVIETNKSDDKFKTAFGAKLTEIVNAAKSVKGYDASKTPANTTEALINDLPNDFTLPKVNTILENITKLLPAVVGGKRLSQHLTKRNNKNRHHGKYTFRNLKRGGNGEAPHGATVTPPGATVTPPGATVTPAETTVTPAETTVTPAETTVTPAETTTAEEEKKATPAPTAETAAPATTGAETATTGAETATTTAPAAATGATPEETKQNVKELIAMFEALGKEKGLGVGVTLEGESSETAAETANLPAAARAPATATTAATPAATATTATTAEPTPPVPVVAEPVETTPAQASAGQPPAEPTAEVPTVEAPAEPSAEPPAQASAGQPVPQAEPSAGQPAPGTGGYKRHTRKNKTKKNRKNSKSKKSKKSKRRK